MKILVSCIPFDDGRSGISIYVRNVVRELAMQGHSLTLLVEPGAEKFFPGFRTVAAPGWTRRAVLSMLYHLFLLPFLLRRHGCDFCVIAAANRRAFAFYPLFTVAVVHDLSQYHVECKYDCFRMFYLKRLLPFFVRRASAVLAISRSTARDLETYWRVPAAKIRVVHNGLPQPETENPAHDWVERSGLAGRRYILYVSRIESPGKNHLNLIRAFELLPDELAARHTLVCAGAEWSGAEAVRAAARRSKHSSRILFTGFLPGGDLGDAYRGASCYVFPSFFEGFGLSLIEAMSEGIPCCCSKTSSLGEIGEGAALLFDPAAPEEIAAALQEILTCEPTRSRLIAAGRARAREFDWGKHAAEIVRMYAERRKEA
ncbi:MAG: glycosyltransferase family 4 protein [Lentisphaeria bacterium]|nr:glycosyltransferase family 4 protein [Lentisphaeria bacterium]